MEKIYKTDSYRLRFLSDNKDGEHIHRDTELLFVIGGNAEVRILDEKFLLSEGDSIIVNSSFRHSWCSAGDAKILEIHYAYKMVTEYTKSPGLFFYCNSSAESDKKYEGIRTIVGDILNSCALEDRNAAFFRTSEVYRLLYYLSVYFTHPSEVNNRNEIDAQFHELLQYISSNYQQKISPGDAANRISLSISHFNRLFRKQTGQSFHAYLMGIRMQSALSELIYTDHSIANIAENNGFPNASASCRSFGQLYKESPAAYRKRHRSEFQEPETKELQIAEMEPYWENGVLHSWHAWLDEPYRINIDTRKTSVTGTEDCRIWTDCICLGDCSLLISGNYRRQVEEIKNEIGFSHGYLRGLFSDELYLREGHESVITRFDRLDEIFDFLVSKGIIPVIAMDNRPSKDPHSIEHAFAGYGENRVFENMEECRQIISGLMKHWLGRYGMYTLRHWSFDIWYDEYHENVLGIKGDFVSLYSQISRIIREYLPDCRIGGCGLSNAIDRAKFDDLITQWSDSDVLPDFLSIPYVSYERQANNGRMIPIFRPDHEFFRETVHYVRLRMAAVGWNDKPLVISGWNMGLAEANWFNDSCSRAASMLSYMADEYDGLSFVVLDPLSDRQGSTSPKKALYGGRGLINRQGIRKPSYYAFEFYSDLGEKLISRGEHYVAGSDSEGAYTILCFNQKDLRAEVFEKLEQGAGPELLNNAFTDDKGMDYIITLTGIPDGDYVIKQLTVSETMGGILPEWERLGEPGEEDREALDYMQRICIPHYQKENVSVENGSVSIRGMLEPHEFRLISVQKRA